MKKQLSNNVNLITESATLKMAQLARDLEAEGKDIISLSLGEPDFDTPEHIKSAAKKALDDGYTKYTPVPGLKELREAVSMKFERDNGLHYGPDQIVISNGAKQSISNLCMALLDPGDEVVVFTPYWVSYYDIIKMNKAKPVCVAAGIEHEFKIQPAQLDEALTDKTKMIIFSSPCNPTGSVFTKEELKELSLVIEKYPQVIVVSDEIYEYINFTGQHASIGQFSNIKEQVVTVNGFSKGFAMTGWRLGYMGAPAWLASACTKIQGQFTSGAASFSQKAAAYALQADMEPTFKMRDAFLQRRDIVKSLLEDIPGITSNEPKGAFYIFPDVSDLFGKRTKDREINNSNDIAEYLLQEAQVATVAGEAFGNDNCIRISYAASEKQLREAIERIKTAVEKLN